MGFSIEDQSTLNLIVYLGKYEIGKLILYINWYLPTAYEVWGNAMFSQVFVRKGRPPLPDI